jgi:hypothetical protein
MSDVAAWLHRIGLPEAMEGGDGIEHDIVTYLVGEACFEHLDNLSRLACTTTLVQRWKLLSSPGAN